MRAALLSVTLSSVLLAAPLSAKAPQQADIKVESNLVLVDLVALDSAGRPVTDLRSDEIEVSEDGKRVAISFFQQRHPGFEQPIDPPIDPGGTGRGEAGDAGELLVFLIDLPSLRPADLPRIKDAVQSFVQSERRANDTLMLAATGVSASQPPTRNAAEFLAVLNKLPAIEGSASRLVRFAAELERLLAFARASDMREQDVTRQAIDLGRRYIAEEEELTRLAADRAIALVREIGSLPGRKTVLYFSGGYRRRIGMAIQELLLRVLPDVRFPDLDSTHVWIRSLLGGPPSASRLDALVRSIIEEANRAQVSFYTADGRGLMAREDARLGALARYADQLVRDDISQPHDFLKDVANSTGGRCFLNTNDLQTGLRAAYQDASEHYELGYVPPHGSESGALHEIDVKVRRPHVTIIHRQSYSVPVAEDAERRSIENAFRFPVLFQEFPFEVDTLPRDGKLKVDVFVPVRALVFTQQADRHKCELAVHMALFDSAGKLYQEKILFSKTYHIDFNETQFTGLANIDNLTTAYEGAVTPGEYRLRVVVRQPMSSKTAALERRITVP